MEYNEAGPGPGQPGPQELKIQTEFPNFLQP